MADNHLVEKLTGWLDEQAGKAGAEGFVVGLSGGIDSAVVAGLCKRVRPRHTLGIIMPCYSDPGDEKDARLVAEYFGIPFKTVCLDEVFRQFLNVLDVEDFDPAKQDLPVVNIKPRLRMTVLYFYAARRKYLVVGTSNRAEIMVGHFTKYGDGGADLLPLANLVKRDVRGLAEKLGVPRKIIERAPSAGLWYGHNDEIELGVTYDQLDHYLLTGDADQPVRETIEKLIRNSEHKRRLPLVPPVF